MKMTSVKRKELRGLLIRFLSSIYPETISQDSIYETFYEYWCVEDIEDELSYIEEKGYVEKKEINTPFNSFSKIKNYKLTAKGKDLLDGTISDPGVYIRG